MNWKDRRVIVIGAARQGTSLTRFLARNGAQVVLTDARPAEELRPVIEMFSDLEVEWALGGHPFELLDGADLVCPSGGVPLTIPFIQEAVRRGIPLSNDSQIFLDAAPCKVIGITGSAGKTTTTTLAGRMAQAAAETGLVDTAYIGGNIGVPLIDQVEQMGSQDLVVLELSSFQLDLMSSSPQVASILNITPNHLDRHGSMEAYTKAKLNILSHQAADDFAVLGFENETAWNLAAEVKGNLLAFGHRLPEEQLGTFIRDGAVWLRTQNGEQQIMTLDTIRLRGEHNVLNVLAACAVAAGAGLTPEAMRVGVEGFTGVEHRLEFVCSLDGVDWYNDSKATSPGMTIISISAFSEPMVVLVGGRDKALPWDEFAQEAQTRVDHLVLFGEAAEIIKAALNTDDRKYTLDVCSNLNEAVQAAYQRAESGDVVLLAPGGTSFDEFSDYEARGAAFKQLVLGLQEAE
jgi:UDP-N-acetylmuramoylalanine--D-glutamate ligase